MVKLKVRLGMPGLVLKFLVATVAFLFVMITWEYFVFLDMAYTNATYTYKTNATMLLARLLLLA